MAIYKNREVSITGLTQPLHVDTPVTVTWDDNAEQVKLSQLKFTKEEIDRLKKEYQGPFDTLEAISDEDVKSVRLGLPPSYDKEAQEMAEARVLRERTQKALDEDNARRKAEAEKKVDQKLKSPKVTPYGNR